MLPVQTILHPTDFSEHADPAFELACALARDYRARLVLLHVAVPPTVVGHATLVPVLELHQQELKQQLRRLPVPAAQVHVERRLEQGDPASVILRVAQETQANLIVMGTHGRTGLGRLLVGSVAEQVLRRAICPVLTVKTPFPQAAPSSSTPTESPADA